MKYLKVFLLALLPVFLSISKANTVLPETSVLPKANLLTEVELEETSGGLLFTLGSLLAFSLLFDFDLVDVELVDNFGLIGAIDLFDPFEVFDGFDLLGI